MTVVDMKGSQLRLKFETGFDEITGEPEYKSKTFNNVDGNATADGLYAVAVAFASLQKWPLGLVERLDQSEIYQG